MSTIEARFPNCGILIVRDFNRLNLPIAIARTLDLIFTNVKGYLKDPIKRPAFGLSDHATIELQPKARCTRPKAKQYILSRDLEATKKMAMSS